MRVQAPWVRTRLRHAPGGAAAVALLVLVASFLAAALPLDLDRYQDRALQQTLARAPISSRALATEQFDTGTGPTDQSPVHHLLQPADPGATGGPDGFQQTAETVAARTRAPLRLDRSGFTWGVRAASPDQPGTGLTMSGPGLPEPDGVPPTLLLSWQQAGDGASGAATAPGLRLTAGRLPADPSAAFRPGGSAPLEIAVSQATARRFGWRPGSRTSVLYGPGSVRQPLLVVGVFAVPAAGSAQAASAYWQSDPLLAAPTEQAKGTPPSTSWNAAALVSRGAAEVLPRLGGATAYWTLPLAGGALHGYQASAAERQVASLQSGTAAADLGGQGIVVTTDLGTLLTQFVQQHDAMAPIIAVGAAGTGGVLLAVLLMQFALAADRRREEVALLRDRGAGPAGVLRRLVAEQAVGATVGTVVGAGVALLLIPGPRHRYGLAAAAAVWLFAVVGGPLRAAWPLRTGSRTGSRAAARDRSEDVVRARPSRRRTVGEALVLLLTAAALTLLHLQGAGGDSGGVNLLLAAAPLLLALLGALVLLRLYPFPLRLAARPARRRRGAVGFLGVARAARTGGTAVLLPLTALILALTTAVFGATVLAGVAAGRSAAGYAQVGGDARVTVTDPGAVPALPTALVDAVRRTPGVRGLVGVLAETDVPFAIQGHVDDVTVYAVDPDAYAALSARIGVGRFDPSLLTAAGPAGQTPVLASPGVAADLAGAGTQQLITRWGTLTVRPAGVLDATPAANGVNYLVLARPASARGATANLLLAEGPVNGPALRRAVAATAHGTGVDVSLRADAVRALDRQPLQSGARGLYLAAVLVAAALALLAVVLSLLQAAPARSALLARLRTMGLTRRQGYALVLTEALPTVVLALLAGVGVGAAETPLLGRSVNLGAVVGAGGDARLGTSVTALLLPAAALLLLTVAAVVAEAAVLGRRQISAQIKAGDPR